MFAKLLKDEELYVVHPTLNLDIITHLNWRQGQFWKILASYQIFSYSWDFSAMCHFDLFALEDIAMLNHKTSTVFGPDLAHKQLACHKKKVSVHLFINYSQHCGSLPRFSPKWLHGHMLWHSFSLTRISKWINYCAEDRSFHGFLQRAVNLISPLYYTASPCLVRRTPLNKSIHSKIMYRNIWNSCLFSVLR